MFGVCSTFEREPSDMRPLISRVIYQRARPTAPDTIVPGRILGQGMKPGARSMRRPPRSDDRAFDQASAATLGRTAVIIPIATRALADSIAYR